MNIMHFKNAVKSSLNLKDSDIAITYILPGKDRIIIDAQSDLEDFLERSNEIEVFDRAI